MPSIGPLQASPFDTFQSQERSLKPFWAISDLDNEKDLLDWATNTVGFCEDYYSIFFNVQLDNNLIYKGVQWLNQSRTSNRFLDKMGVVTRKSPRVVLNYTLDNVESKVSRNTRYRPKVAFFPANQEQSDRDDAKIAQEVNDYIWYVNVIEKKLGRWLRQVFVAGEGFLFVNWNPNKGAVHPDFLAAKKEGRRIPVLDPDGNPILNSSGEPMNIERTIRIGEVDVETVPSWHVFEMPCASREEVDWCIRWDAVDIEYLKAKYPDRASDIKADDRMEVFSNYKLDIAKLASECIVYTLYHRHHEFLPEGRMVKFTKDTVLENTKLPYSHGELPYIYIEDIEQPDVHRGTSSIQQLFPIQHQINACASLVYKALVLFAHPKIVHESGSVQMSQLLAESTLLAVDPGAGFAPHILANPTVPQELFQYLAKLEQVFDRLSGTFSLSHGQAPNGVRAAKALRVLEEQEDKRNYYFGVKYQESMVKLAKMCVSVAGDYYDDADGRLLNVVGRGNEYKLLQFKSAQLASPFECRIENVTALSQSPAARIDSVNEIAAVKLDERSPISTGQFLELSGLADNKEFESVQTRAFRCAQSENEDFASGRPVADPTPDEDIITHLKTHYQMAQSREFKELLAPERKQAYIQHITITEYLAWEKAYGITDIMGFPIQMPNPVFQQKLMMLEAFPSYFKIPPPNQPAMPPMMAGGPINGMSPLAVDGQSLQVDPMSAQPAPIAPEAMGQPPLNPVPESPIQQ